MVRQPGRLRLHDPRRRADRRSSRTSRSTTSRSRSPIASGVERGPAQPRMSCFGKGTPVRTLTGSRPIETLERRRPRPHPGHAHRQARLPARSPSSTTTRPAPPSRSRSATTRSSPATSTASGSSGRGWVMARDLKEGDPVRTLGGVAKVTRIEPGEVQPVFNLDVADDADFFAGEAAAPGPRQHPARPQAGAVRRPAGRRGEVSRDRSGGHRPPRKVNEAATKPRHNLHARVRSAPGPGAEPPTKRTQSAPGEAAQSARGGAGAPSASSGGRRPRAGSRPQRWSRGSGSRRGRGRPRSG